MDQASEPAGADAMVHQPPYMKTASSTTTLFSGDHPRFFRVLPKPPHHRSDRSSPPSNDAPSATGLCNPDKGFSGCGFELIAGLKVALGLERVDLVGGNGGDDVNEGVDDGSMLGQIEGRELLDRADDGLGHVPGIEQSFILQRYGQRLHVLADAGEQ